MNIPFVVETVLHDGLLDNVQSLAHFHSSIA